VFSIVAQIISQLINTEIYHWFVTRITRRHQWLRVLISNSVAIPIDNLIFVVGAFGWAMPWSTVWDIFIVSLVVKYFVMLFSIPLIYTTRYDAE
jgi:queuosine precursor transporter